MSKTLCNLVVSLLKKYGLDHAQADASVMLKLANEPYMPLVIERLRSDEYGCVIYSVSHTFVQNGDVMHDPEMCFEVGTGFPLSFHMDPCIPLNGGRNTQYVFSPPNQRQRYYPRLSRELRSFASQWAKNLRDQGFCNTARTRVVDCSHYALLPDKEKARLAAQ